MPVQYTPQFIPTNAQALQGVLSEYQQAYDQNLARELEIQDQYSMIPTINAADTQKKNEILGSFAQTMGEVEKKYNYDRASSSYSKELARKIGELRKNDFWSYNERKKELAKAEAEDKRRIGAGYVSKYSPSQATYEDQTALDNYQPMNLEDLYKQVYTKGKEWATANANPIEEVVKYNGVPIALERGQQLGFSKPEEVDAFLKTDAGKEFIASTIASSGFGEMADDPRILGMARDAAFASLIGERQTDKYSIPSASTKTEEPVLPMTTSLNRTLKEEVAPVGARKGAQAVWKGYTKVPFTDQEKAATQDALTTGLMGNFLGKYVLGQGIRRMVGLATSLSSARKSDTADNDVYNYLYSKALTPNPDDERDMNTYNSGMRIAQNALQEYGIEGVTPEELYREANAISMTRGEKNSINKALEELTGRDLSKGSGGRDIGREWNTWWESGGKTNKDKYQTLLKNREQTWVTSVDNFMVKEGEQNSLGDWVATIAPFGEPFLTGLSSLDGGTKEYSGKNMVYFDNDKLQEFFSGKGNYRVQRSTSGDDMPFITLRNPEGKEINLSFPVDRFQSIDEIYAISGRFGDWGFGNDVILSKFDIKAGQVVDQIDDDMKIALIDRMKYKSKVSGQQYNPSAAQDALSNAEQFFEKYDVRKTDKSGYQVREKNGTWTNAQFTKEQLFELLEDTSILE